MRANAAKREVQLYLDRTTTGLYRWQQRQRQSAGNTVFKDFVLHDGPPYANGPPHMGHVLNKVLKDIINRNQLLNGCRVQYIPGWDCHGLPIELKALKEYTQPLQAASHEDASRALQVREIARACALEAIGVQQKAFERWGIMADWDLEDGCSTSQKIYRTLDPEYEAMQLEVLAAMVDRGCIQRGFRPVHWSPSSKTALAEAELEYVDAHVSTAVHCSFRLMQTGSNERWNALAQTYAGVSVVVWTTTAWTLPANMAICVHPNLSYVVLHVADRGNYYMVAEDLVADFSAALNVRAPLASLRHLTPTPHPPTTHNFVPFHQAGCEASPMLHAPPPPLACACPRHPPTTHARRRQRRWSWPSWLEKIWSEAR